jgi:hypothetical protein
MVSIMSRYSGRLGLLGQPVAVVVDVAQVDALVPEMAEQQFIRLVRHSTSPSAQNL